MNASIETIQRIGSKLQVLIRQRDSLLRENERLQQDLNHKQQMLETEQMAQGAVGPRHEADDAQGVVPVQPVAAEKQQFVLGQHHFQDHQKDRRPGYGVVMGYEANQGHGAQDQVRL